MRKLGTATNFLLSGKSVAVPIFLLAVSRPLSAEHASIELTLSGGGKQVEAFTDQEPPAGGVQKRPVLTVKAGEPLVFQFFLTNVYPHGLVSNVTVRYRVSPVPAEGGGGSAAAKADSGAKTAPPRATVTEGSMTLNFKPRCRVGSRVCFKAPAPGRYLVRVDTEGTKSDHEHFSAVELVVVAADGQPR